MKAKPIDFAVEYSVDGRTVRGRYRVSDNAVVVTDCLTKQVRIETAPGRDHLAAAQLGLAILKQQ